MSADTVTRLTWMDRVVPGSVIEYDFLDLSGKGPLSSKEWVTVLDVRISAAESHVTAIVMRPNGEQGTCEGHSTGTVRLQVMA